MPFSSDRWILRQDPSSQVRRAFVCESLYPQPISPGASGFSPQFKAEAVQMVLETKRPIADVARDLGINEGTLGNWVNRYRQDHPEPDSPLTPVDRARLAQLEDENRKLRMENEFLKKAAAYAGDLGLSSPFLDLV
jgi:transposase